MSYDRVQCNACGLVMSVGQIGHICRRDPMRMLDAQADAIARLEARIAQLEQDADPRTAEGDALDRWARIVGEGSREPGETDVELRARIEGDEEDAPVLVGPFYGIDPGYADGVVTFTSEQRDLSPWVSVGRGYGKSLAIGTAIHGAYERMIAAQAARYLPEGTEPPGLNTGAEPVAALAIGTRVRIDDKTLAWHDHEGVVVAATAGGAYFDVKLDGGTFVAHRSQLALVDDTLPECGTCHGVGQLPLFTGLADCDTCGGSGVVSP